MFYISYILYLNMPEKHKMMNKITALIFLVSLLLAPLQHAYAESYQFATAPSHSKKITREIYTPVIKYLAQKTGKEIELVIPFSFLDYVNKMKTGTYDIIFDGPHFASWRIKNLSDIPIARLPGDIKIAIITTEQHKDYNNLDDLIGQRVCAIASPNLLTMSFLNHYKNPLRLPIIVPAKGFKGLVQCLKSGKGKAAVLRDKMWNKINKSGLKLISIPDDAYPDRTFTVSSRIDPSTQEKIRQALMAPEAGPHLAKLLSTFKKTELIAATVDEYNGIDQLLNQLWAFRPRR